MKLCFDFIFKHLQWNDDEEDDDNDDDEDEDDYDDDDYDGDDGKHWRPPLPSTSQR